MSDEEVYEAAKTSAKIILGVVLSLSFLILLDRYSVIEMDLGIDPTILVMFLGALMSISILAYFMDQLEWL